MCFLICLPKLGTPVSSDVSKEEEETKIKGGSDGENSETNRENEGDVGTVEMLEESWHLLRDLYNAQHRRLGDFSSAALAEERSLRPCGREIHKATHLADKLVTLISRLTRGPGDVLTSREPVRRALGLDPDAPALTTAETINLLSEK